MAFRSSNAAAAPSTLEQTSQLRCIQLLGMLGSSGSEAAVHALKEIEQTLLRSEAAVPKGLLDDTVAALCTASASGAGSALLAASLALNSWVERMHAFHDPSLQAVLLHICVVARGCHAWPHAEQAPAAELQKQQGSLEHLVGVLEGCLAIIHAAEEKEGRHQDAISPTSCQTRVAIAEAAVQLMEIDIALFEGEENSDLKNDCLDRLAKLLGDPCYQGRSRGAKLCMFLFDKFKDVKVRATPPPLA